MAVTYMSYISESYIAIRLSIFYGDGLTTTWKNCGIDKIFNPVSHFDTSSFYLCIELSL